MRLVGSGLRTIVVTLDPKRNESQSDAPAALLRSLGHQVDVVITEFGAAELQGLTVHQRGMALAAIAGALYLLVSIGGEGYSTRHKSARSGTSGVRKTEPATRQRRRRPKPSCTPRSARSVRQ